jgi:hypothetical protein
VRRSHALLAGLFDYAGLFPPASLPLAETVARYACHRASRDGWMLGRLVVPAADLETLSALATPHLADGIGAHPWRVSVLSSDSAADVSRVEAFNRRHADPAGAAVVDAIETRVSSAEDVRALRVWAARGFDVYCEAPLGADLERVLDEVAKAGLHAKIRTGGTTGAATPGCDDVAAFLCGCVARGVVAKATAGLHHAVTGEHPLGAEPAAERTTMLGYLNLVLGAGIAEGAGRAAVQSRDVRATVTRLLSLTTTPSWVGHAQVEWRGPGGPIIEGPLEHFAVAGRALIRSIGTCSFSEPVADARRIGLIA